MNSWTMAVFMTALRDLLRDRAGLSGVLVCSAPIDQNTLAGEMEAMTFVDVTANEEPAALGKNRTEEVYTVEGIIQVLKDGADEATAVAARDRAAALLAEVEAQIRATPDAGLGGAVVRHAHVSSKALRQSLQDQRRRAIIEYDIRVSTRIGT